MNLDDIKVKKNIKIVFMGTPVFAVPILEGLIQNYNVRAIVSQPNRKVGREGNVVNTPIKEVGDKNTILVLQPEHIKDIKEDLINMEPDIIITCAYGQILPVDILNIPRLGCINVHASLLPKLRGGAPIHRAIIDGYETTGVTIMYMDKKMDNGDIISSKEIKIDDNDTMSTLHNKLSILGRDLLLETLPSIIDGTNKRIVQDESQVTYAFNISKEDEKIDFSKTKKQIYNQIRGLKEFPGAYAILEGKRMKIWSSYITNHYFNDKLNGQITEIYQDGFGVKVGNGEIVITEVQMEGKKRMKAIEFMQGRRDLKGKIFG
jgi:methionyl-tRNA formyltransferase